MHIDIKVTIWERLHLDKDQEEIVRQAIVDGKLRTETELAEHGVEGKWEMIYETEEVLNPEDNNGCATLEVWENKGDDKPMYLNAK